MDSIRKMNKDMSSTMPSLASITNRSIHAYYKHLDRFKMERSKSMVSLNRSVKSGRPAILKPLKLWKPTQGKEKMMWVYGNPWNLDDPKYLRTGSGQMTKIDGGSSNKGIVIDLRLSSSIKLYSSTNFIDIASLQ